MKSKFSTIKKFFFSFAVLIWAVLASFSMFSFNLLPTYSASSVENPNFSNNMSDNTNTPSSPSSYTFVDSNFKSVSYNPQSTTANQPKITAGVVNIEEKGYTKPSSDQDNFALMISSEKDGSSYSVKYGYTSTSFSLNAGSYYKIAVDVYVDNAQGLASLYLVDENSKAFESYEHVGKSNNWTTYMFLVETDQFTSYNLKLAMFLDGNGTVLFDSVNVKELSKQQLTTEKNIYSSSCKVVEPKTDNYISSITFSKSNMKKAFANTSSVSYDIEDSDNYFNSAIQIINSPETYSQYETNDDCFTFEPNRVYKLTVSAKTLNLSGKASLRLVQTDEVDEDGNPKYDTSNDHTISITSDTSSTLNNGYQRYTFIINSHPLKTTTFKLVVSLGDEDTATSGSISLTGAVLTKATYKNFEDASTGSSTQKINIASTTVDVSSDIKALTLSNGSFNYVKTTDTTKTYPATPANWTVSLGANNQLYGVVNTKTEEFAKFTSNNSFTSSAINPGNPIGSDSNNVLMMYNSVTDTLSYTSEIEKSLDANSYHRFSLKVLTQHSTLNIYLVATINNKEVVLSSLKNVTTAGLWKDVDLYVNTGLRNLTVGVKVEMKSTGYGFAYVDDATFDYAPRTSGVLGQPTIEEFDKVQNTTYVNKADLTNLTATDSTTAYAPADHFNSTENENVKFGILNADDEIQIKNVLKGFNQNYQAFNLVDNKNILAIHAINYVKEQYTANLGYRFESNKYYLLTVKVYTQNLASESDKFGLGLSLSNYDEKFENINTEDGTNNGWKTYSFYITPTDTATSYLTIDFGTDTANLTGDAFIGDIVVKEIEQSEFVTESSDTIKVLSTPAKDDSNDDNNDSDNSSNNKNNSAWFIAIPTVLTFLAIGIAVVGVTLRKVKIKKPVKKTKNAYDRNSKQSQQIYMRKATTMREERLRELEKQLETLQAERLTYEEQYKKDLSSLRQLKIKRAPATEIAKLEKDMKINQKHSAQIGANVRWVENEIEQTKTDEYLRQTVKKLASVKQDEQEQ